MQTHTNKKLTRSNQSFSSDEDRYERMLLRERQSEMAYYENKNKREIRELDEYEKKGIINRATFDNPNVEFNLTVNGKVYTDEVLRKWKEEKIREEWKARKGTRRDFAGEIKRLNQLQPEDLFKRDNLESPPIW